ncbi:MAG: zf-HC2 domain-containing protein [candidate division WOR-3 bacterium]|nr:zf-HC2 domain-containing protein [candidate division WOR-3 bacterium]
MKNEKEKTTCPFSIEMLSAYIDNELNEMEKFEVVEHLKTCVHCQKIVREFKEIDEALHQLEIEEPSKEFIYQLKRNVLSKVKKEKRPLLRYFPVLVPLAVAILIIVILQHGRMEPVVSMEYRIAYEDIKEVEKEEVVAPSAQKLTDAKFRLKSISRAIETEDAKKTAGEKWEPEMSSSEFAPILDKEIYEKGIIRAMVDSTGKVVSVAKGKALKPEEDTILTRLLKGKKIMSPRLLGKPAQVFVEITPEPRDSN